MTLADEIKTLLVRGKYVTITITYNPGTDYTGVVEKVQDGEFELSGGILNQEEHFSNTSAEPVYRRYTFDIKDIASIRKA